MFWFWLIVAFLAGGASGFYLAAGAIHKDIRPALQTLNLERAADKSLLLKTFRRELANWMLRTDPDAYVKLAKEVTAEAKQTPDLKKETQEVKLKEIAADFPYFSDFDTIGGREHVLYNDGSLDFEEAMRAYRSIAVFEALKQQLDPDWRFTQPISEGDATHLEEYVQRLKDGRFLKRLMQAMSHFWSYRQGRADQVDSWETSEFTIRRVTHFAEAQYGVQFKDTGERGIFSTFYDGDRFLDSWHRADDEWKQIGGLGLSDFEE